MQINIYCSCRMCYFPIEIMSIAVLAICSSVSKETLPDASTIALPSINFIASSIDVEHILSNIMMSTP